MKLVVGAVLAVLSMIGLAHPNKVHIGVDKPVKTFFELALFGGLSGDKAAPGAVAAPTMADTVTGSRVWARTWLFA